MTGHAIYPRLVTGLAVIPTDDGLIVEGLAASGTAERRLFTGSAATQVLPRLLPLLDGKHDVTDIAEASGLPGEHAAQAIALLARSGLLRTGPTAQTPAEVFIDRAFRSPQHIRTRLAEAAVAVAVPEPLATILIDDLIDSGIGTVHRGPSADVDLLIADDGQPADTDTATLRVAGREVGPLMTGVDTLCASCARADRTSGDFDAAPHLLGSLTVATALTALTGGSTVERGKLVIDPDDLSVETVDVTPHADCDRCTLVDDSQIARLEWLNRGRPTGSGDFRPQSHADLATSPLTAHDALPETIGAALSALATDTATDVYVIGAGLPYPIHRHTPDGLRATRADLTEPPRLRCLPPNPLAVAVLVAAPDRWLPQFGPQSLRRAFLSAGRALERLPSGHPTFTATWFDADLPDLLEVHDDREVVAVVVGFYATPPGSPSGTREPEPAHPTGQPTAHGRVMGLDFGAPPVVTGRIASEAPEPVMGVLSQAGHPLTAHITGRRILIGAQASASAADFRAACVAAGQATAALHRRLGGAIDDETSAWPRRGDIVHLSTLVLPEEA